MMTNDDSKGDLHEQLVDIVFRNNIVLDTTDTFTSDGRTVMLDAYMDDTLFAALRDGISFEDNCYTSQRASFGFAEATGQGALGGDLCVSDPTTRESLLPGFRSRPA